MRIEYREKLDKWDRRYLTLASDVASWSKDPSTKTGAVIVGPDNYVVSMGFNGLPRGIEDSDERLNNRELKLDMIVHCEVNALVAAKRSVEGCTLYTWPFLSCSRCAAIMIQAGIKRVVAPSCPDDKGYWQPNLDLAKMMFEEAGVEVCESI